MFLRRFWVQKLSEAHFVQNRPFHVDLRKFCKFRFLHQNSAWLWFSTGLENDRLWSMHRLQLINPISNGKMRCQERLHYRNYASYMHLYCYSKALFNIGRQRKIPKMANSRMIRMWRTNWHFPMIVQTAHHHLQLHLPAPGENHSQGRALKMSWSQLTARKCPMKEYSKLVRKFECRTFTGLVLSFIANQISSHPIGKREEKLTFYPCQQTGSIYFHLLHILSISPWVPKYFQSCTTILGPSIALSVQADLQISFFHSHLQKDTLHVLGIILNVDSDVYELVEKYTHFSAFLYLQ